MGGVLLQQLSKEMAKEVTGLISVKGFIFTVGWDRIVTCFFDEPIESIIQCPVTVQWDKNYRHIMESMGPITHDDDIISMACSQESLLATGSFDGVVIVRQLKSGKLISKLITPPTVKICNGVEELKSSSVEFLVWLSSRSHGKAASLISSSNGSLYFWNVFTSKLMGVFKPAPMEEKKQFDDRVSLSCLATDAANRVVIVGDSIGHVRIFSIADQCLVVHAGESIDLSRKIPSVCTLLQLKAWKAHSLSISSIIYVDESCQIVSGSADRFVKIWTCSGQLINSLNSNNVVCNFKDPFPTLEALCTLSKKSLDVGDSSLAIVSGIHISTTEQNCVASAAVKTSGVLSAGSMSPGDKARGLTNKVTGAVADATAVKMAWRATFPCFDSGNELITFFYFLNASLLSIR